VPDPVPAAPGPVPPPKLAVGRVPIATLSFRSAVHPPSPSDAPTHHTIAPTRLNAPPPRRRSR
jgi:hypothetical protein